MATAALRAHSGGLGLEPTPDSLRHALAGYPTGIALVTAEVEGRLVGMLANSFTSVSLEPPMVSVAFARTSTTWPTLRRAHAWGISVLGEQHTDLITALSRPAADRFDGVEMVRDAQGAAFAPGTVAAFAVSLHSEIDAGDHILTLLRVHAVHRDADQSPLVFYNSRMHHLES